MTLWIADNGFDAGAAVAGRGVGIANTRASVSGRTAFNTSGSFSATAFATAS